VLDCPLRRHGLDNLWAGQVPALLDRFRYLCAVASVTNRLGWGSKFLSEELARVFCCADGISLVNDDAMTSERGSDGLLSPGNVLGRELPKWALATVIMLTGGVVGTCQRMGVDRTVLKALSFQGIKFSVVAFFGATVILTVLGLLIGLARLQRVDWDSAAGDSLKVASGVGGLLGVGLQAFHLYWWVMPKIQEVAPVAATGSYNRGWVVLLTALSGWFAGRSMGAFAGLLAAFCLKKKDH